MNFILFMAYFLGLLFLFGGLGSCALSKSAVHEIGGLVSLLIGFGLIMAGLILQRLIDIHATLRLGLPVDEQPPAS